MRSSTLQASGEQADHEVQVSPTGELDRDPNPPVCPWLPRGPPFGECKPKLPWGQELCLLQCHSPGSKEMDKLAKDAALPGSV